MVTINEKFKTPYYKQLIGMIERVRRNEVRKTAIEDDNIRMSVYTVTEDKIRIDLSRSKSGGVDESE